MNAVKVPVIAALALVLSAGVLAARDHEIPAPARGVALERPAARHAALSMTQAVRLVQHRFKARVVRAETQRQGNRTIYVLRMLDDAGRVFAVRVDAASGAIL